MTNINGRNKLVDLMTRCIIQDIEYMVISSNRVFYQDLAECIGLSRYYYYGPHSDKLDYANWYQGNKLDTAEDQVEYIGDVVALRWIAGFLVRYKCSALLSEEKSHNYQLEKDIYTKKIDIRLPVTTDDHDKTFAQIVHSLILGRDDVPTEFKKLSIEDQKIICETIDDALKTLNPNIYYINSDRNRREARWLYGSSKSILKELRKNITEDKLLRHIGSLIAEKMAKYYIETYSKAPKENYYNINSAMKAEELFKSKAENSGNIEKIIMEKLDPNMFLQFFQVVFYKYLSWAGILDENPSFSNDSDASVALGELYIRDDDVTKINEIIVGNNLPLTELSVNERGIVYRNLQDAVSKLKEVYNADKRYASYKADWQEILKRMDVMLATMKIKMQDQSGQLPNYRGARKKVIK